MILADTGVRSAIASFPLDERRLSAYDRLCGAGEAKKILEMTHVNELVPSPSGISGPRVRSLDIGCATGRYPGYFTSRGYDASGYDISADAVRLSRSFSPHARIEQRNVLEMAPEQERYSVITCMMGTLNHISRDMHGNLVSWAFRSLRPGGIFIVSFWNASCGHLSCIDLYSESERQFLLANAPTAQEFEALSAGLGFIAGKCRPLCLFPDECLVDWRASFCEARLRRFDDSLARAYGTSNAQLLLCCSQKPADIPRSALTLSS